ncbi:hypothetical protein ACI65C_002502 [Semiaphis heraclei]
MIMILLNFFLVLVPFCSTINTTDAQVLQPIEIIYPNCFRATEKTGVMVYEKYISPIHGYAISSFESPNTSRNHFYRRNVNDKIKIIVLHYTVVNFRTTVKMFTSISSNTSTNVSSHYVIAKNTEAGTHNQLLQFFCRSYQKLSFRITPENPYGATTRQSILYQ